MIKCSKCGHENQDTNKFCAKCGSPLVLKKRCPSCGAELEKDAAFCGNCGKKIEPENLFCTNCGAKLTEGTKFCVKCGTPASGIQPAVEAVPPAAEPVNEPAVSATAQPQAASTELTVEMVQEFISKHPGATEYVVPENVEHIGEWFENPFEGTNFEKIVFSGSILELSNMDRMPSLKSVVISEGVMAIRQGFLAWCENLEELVLPSTLKVIESYAFSCCPKLKKVSIPNAGKIFIDCGAFSMCEKLDEIVFEGEDSAYAFEGGFLYLKEGYTIKYEGGDNASALAKKLRGRPFRIVEKEGSNASELISYTGSAERAVLPSSITCIRSGLSNITTPENYPLKHLVIHENAVLKGNVARNPGRMLEGLLDGLNGLESISLPASFSIGNNDLFLYKTDTPKRVIRYVGRRKDVIIPSAFHSIGKAAFICNKNIRSVEIGDNVKVIEDNAFSECDNLDTVILHESDCKMSGNAFSFCKKLGDFTIPAKMKITSAPIFSTEYSPNLFIQTYDKFSPVVKLCKSEGIPYRIIEKIEKLDAAFMHDWLSTHKDAKYFITPSCVTAIAKGAFADCKNLERIWLHTKISEIEDGAFDGCNAKVIARVYTTAADLCFKKDIKAEIIDRKIYSCPKCGEIFMANEYVCHKCGEKSMDSLNALFLEYAYLGMAEKLRFLLAEGADVNAKNDIGTTAYMFAVQCEDTSIPKLLMDAGAEINVVNNKGNTPLLFASKFAFGLPVIKMLLDAGLDVNAKNNAGATPLMFAAGYAAGSEVVKVLLDAGADIETTFRGYTLMKIADGNKTPAKNDIMALLRERGAK